MEGDACGLSQARSAHGKAEQQGRHSGRFPKPSNWSSGGWSMRRPWEDGHCSILYTDFARSLPLYSPNILSPTAVRLWILPVWMWHAYEVQSLPYPSSSSSFKLPGERFPRLNLFPALACRAGGQETPVSPSTTSLGLFIFNWTAHPDMPRDKMHQSVYARNRRCTQTVIFIQAPKFPFESAHKS